MYGTVFKAVNLQTGETVALKTQRPAWVWEYYIVREIKARLTNPHMVQYNIREYSISLTSIYLKLRFLIKLFFHNIVTIFFFSYVVLWM